MKCKKELILKAEEAFTAAISRAVFDKPLVSLWMILIPVLLLHFIYRMKQHRNGLEKFQTEFMITRKKALEIAAQAVEEGIPPRIEEQVLRANLPSPLSAPYRGWVTALVGFYTILLSSEGEDFESLVRNAFSDRLAYLGAISDLCEAEKVFYAALRPHFVETGGAVEIMATIEVQSRRLRTEAALTIFSPGEAT